jgi:hypothetical protein
MKEMRNRMWAIRMKGIREKKIRVWGFGCWG